MIRRLILGSLFGVILFSLSCAVLPYAREVKKKPHESGVIALRTRHSVEDRAKADHLMASNCGMAGFKIIEEGEVVVGEKTTGSAQKSTDKFGGSSLSLGGGGISFGSTTPSENTTTSSETTQVKEWQINYECNAAASTASAAPVTPNHLKVTKNSATPKTRKGK